MQTIWQSKGKKIHKRKIEVSTYIYDGQRIIAEGFLKDDRFQDSYLITGEKFPKGVIHHMAIRLLVNCSNLVIEDVDVELIAVPREVCRETINWFTLKIKKIAGGNKGCTHLVELLQTMAPAVFQGYATHLAQKPASFDSDQGKMILQFLINTCHAWRENGPFVEMLKKKIHMKLS
jgi:hypothetical protein